LAVCICNLKNTSTNNIISLIKFSNGSYSYILNTYGYDVGFFTRFFDRTTILKKKYFIGDVVFFKNLKPGSIIYNICNLNLKKSIYARSPGTYCIFLSFFNETTVKIKLPSGKIILLNFNFSCVLGRNSNLTKVKEVVGKAGRNILRGFKPSVRGVAMNPVDHPHGGRTKTNSPEKTPWGKIAKFKK